MEREELELINRLKNTKMLEEAAHNDLEGALTDPDPSRRLRESQAGKGRGKMTRGVRR